MRPPQLTGTVERRLLVNYRVDPDAVARLLPRPFRPHLVGQSAVAGICLIRLSRLRPPQLPSRAGLSSENAAHRIAVEWDTPHGLATGVYIPRRDTGSLANVVIGGRLFPGEHHRARFEVRDTPPELTVAFDSSDRTTRVRVHAIADGEWRQSSLFASIGQASEFFRQGSVGYSARADGSCLDGLELQTRAWQVQPVEVVYASSTFFDDAGRFPPGTATLDCGLLMRDLPVTWNPLSPMRIDARIATVHW